MRRLLAVLFVLALVVGAMGPVGAEPPAQEPVTVLGPWFDFPDEEDADLADAFVAELERVAGNRFEIIYEYADEIELVDRVEGPNPPDLIITRQPGLLADLAAELVDLSEFVNPKSLRRDFGDYLIDLATVDGAVLGGPVEASLKSLVWYKTAVFAAHGYAVPETFTELVALSDAMVADGETPWCNYIESGFATGWMGTDWVEDLLLGAEGPEVYDQWVDHSVVFQDPRVEIAFERYQQMIDTAGYVFDRPNMLSVPFWANVFPLAEEDCLMHKQASYFSEFIRFNLGDEYLDEFATFKFPSVDAEFDAAVVGGGSFVAALNQRTEVRQLVRFMLSDRFGREALAEAGGFVLPNQRFDTRLYTDGLNRSIAEDIQAALRDDQFRFDASDLMPPEVGIGSFWTGIVDLVSGAKTIPEVLSDIDATWPS